VTVFRFGINGRGERIPLDAFDVLGSK